MVTDLEIDALVARLDAGLRRGDVRALAAVAPGIDVAAWRRRVTTLRRFPLDSVRFGLDRTLGRQVNASGGPVDLTAYLVLTHRIVDCDASPVTQAYDARLTKPGRDATLTITRLRQTDATSPAPWDLGDYRVVQGDHVVLAATRDDLPRARAGLPRIDAGVARAMALIPPADGVSRLFVALADPGCGPVRPGPAPEYTGLTRRVGEPGSRVVLHPAAFGSPDGLQRVALHESVHALAHQWGPGAPAWPAEGHARVVRERLSRPVCAPSGTATRPGALGLRGLPAPDARAAQRRGVPLPGRGHQLRLRRGGLRLPGGATGWSAALRLRPALLPGQHRAAARMVTGLSTRALLARTQRWVDRL